jgi:uncharacterized MAPEG superfamily protein
MTTELMYLTLVALLTAVLAIPYTLNMITMHGMMYAVGNRDTPKALAPWAERAKRGHYNAIENLVVFAAVVLVAHALNRHTGGTAMAAMIYFWARLVHYIVYAVGLPWIRTLSWTVGWICCLVFIWTILA